MVNNCRGDHRESYKSLRSRKLAPKTMQPEGVKTDAGHSRLPVTIYIRICHLGKATYWADKKGSAFRLGRETHWSPGTANTESHDSTCTCLSGPWMPVHPGGRRLLFCAGSSFVPKRGVQPIMRCGLFFESFDGAREKLQYLGPRISSNYSCLLELETFAGRNSAPSTGAHGSHQSAILLASAEDQLEGGPIH